MLSSHKLKLKEREEKSREKSRGLKVEKERMKSSGSLLKNLLFVLGRPGSGKGTCCELLAQRYPDQILHLSAGELLRRSCEQDPHGQVATCLAAGCIVPSYVTVGLLQAAMEHAKQQLILIDGFPRTTENRNGFLSALGRDATAAMLIDVSEEECIRRLKVRKRHDDHDDGIRQRIHTFELETKPILEVYEKEQRLLLVSGEDVPDRVCLSASQQLKHRGFLTERKGITGID